MGMFDDLTIEYPFPDADFQNAGFQTKDLDCMMDRYKIDKDGQLWKLYGHWKEMPEFSERMDMQWEEIEPYFDASNWVDDPPVQYEDMHGDIYVCTSRQRNGVREFYEWRIRFTHGKVENIILTESPELRAQRISDESA